MESVYIIIENGESYPNAYTTYMGAVSAVKGKHKEYLKEQINSLESVADIESILSDINVPENVESGKTYLYIEKGIHILINKLPIT